MNRLGLLSPSDLSREAKEFYDVIYTYLSAKYSPKPPPLRNVRKDGVMLGPFGLHMHTPAVGQHFHGLGAEVEKLPGFSKHNREIAILTTAAKYQAAYAMNAHNIIAKAQGVTQYEIDTILKDQMPNTLDEQGQVIYNATYELVHGRGPLSEKNWDKLVKMFSIDGAKCFVHLVGFYSYLCVVLNGFDAKIPES